MTTAFDVPANDLINALTKKLENEPSIVPPEWSKYVRTGVHTENPPMQKNWWHVRCASILRKIYISNGIGAERLRQLYGGFRDRGSKPNRARAGSGSIAREALQQLEKAGYVTRVKGVGRVLTPKGRSFVDNTAHEIMQSIIEKQPELKKY
ncbi:MAG: 30S ribosomal protein S19e [Candidatus Thermoplasmatota archaeon]